MRYVCLMLASLLAASLSAQDPKCPQSGGDTKTETCGTCTASVGAGITMTTDCSGSCQTGGNCPACCFECEGSVTFDGDPLNRLVVVRELRSTPVNSDSDSSGPTFIVQINVTLSCAASGGQGTTKCVEFMAEHNGQGGHDPWQRTKHCYRLNCDPCQ